MGLGRVENGRRPFMLRPGTFENPERGEAALRIFKSSGPESAMNLLDDCELVNSTPRPRRDDSSRHWILEVPQSRHQEHP